MLRILLMVIRNFWRVPAAWFKLCHYAKHTDEYSYEEKYKHIQYILKLAVTSGNIDFQVYGQENIPQEDGMLICGNHQGMFDVLAIVAAFDRPLAAVLKKELADIPFLKQIVACTHSYPMDREDVRQSMKVIMGVTKEIAEGRNFLIFPEGTRSKNGNHMLDFHGGTFKCATKSKCTILPFALIDSYKVLDHNGVEPVTVQLHYLEPIPYEEYKDMNTNELAAMVHDRVEKKLEEVGAI
ncbi:MAG: 1-acyl-sn-glycerol-3-phosphate acyltransferase [Roseburia sp.]|nr:1-acyl-sn-glycerol-3-phosphate acyltransferase [Roseburia sp.]